MNDITRFTKFTHGELDSLNTALGNSTRRLATMMGETQEESLSDYYGLCIGDNSRLMAEINAEIINRQ